MKLKQQLNSDFKEAFKSKDTDRLSVLKMVQAEIRNAEIVKRGKMSKAGEQNIDETSQLNDEEIIEVISREAKKRKDSIIAYEKGGRQDLADKEKKETKILSVYLPEQIGEEELKKIIEEIIKETGISDMKDLGKLMSVIMPKVKGRADGGMVQRIAKEIIEF